MSIHSFTDLEVWKKARVLRKSISTLTQKLTEVKKILNGYIKYLAKAKQLPLDTDETPPNN